MKQKLYHNMFSGFNVLFSIVKTYRVLSYLLSKNVCTMTFLMFFIYDKDLSIQTFILYTPDLKK